MCGIVAVVALADLQQHGGSRPSPSRSTRAELEAALSELQHRGPDLQQVWLNDDGRLGERVYPTRPRPAGPTCETQLTEYRSRPCPTCTE